MFLEALQRQVLDHVEKVGLAKGIEVHRSGERALSLIKGHADGLLALRVESANAGYMVVLAPGIRHHVELADDDDVRRVNEFIDAVLDGHGYIAFLAHADEAGVIAVEGWDVHFPSGAARSRRGAKPDDPVLRLGLPAWT